MVVVEVDVVGGVVVVVVVEAAVVETAAATVVVDSDEEHPVRRIRNIEEKKRNRLNTGRQCTPSRRFRSSRPRRSVESLGKRRLPPGIRK